MTGKEYINKKLTWCYIKFGCSDLQMHNVNLFAYNLYTERVECLSTYFEHYHNALMYADKLNNDYATTGLQYIVYVDNVVKGHSKEFDLVMDGEAERIDRRFI